MSSSQVPVSARRPGRLRPPRSATVVKIGLVAPALLMFTVFYIVPIVAGVVLSLFRWNGLEPPAYVGFANYEQLFSSDPVFMTNVRVTLIAVVVSLVVVLPLALLLAVCLSGRGRLLPLFRALLFVPVVIPLTAAALMWAEIFNPAGGVGNELLDTVGLGPVSWLGEQTSALWSLILVTIWSMLGIHIVIQLSALSAIPTELKEAARLETPSSWRVFRHVVLPLLRDALTVSAVLIVTGSFVFYTAIAFILTRGGPVNATESLGLRAYLEGFGALDFGRANAITVITMLITIAMVGLVLLVGSRRRVEY
jgi:ABC-type sugar transport system permease subunit